MYNITALYISEKTVGFTCLKIEMLYVYDSKTKEAEFHNSIFRASLLLSNGWHFVKTNVTYSQSGSNRIGENKEEFCFEADEDTEDEAEEEDY